MILFFCTREKTTDHVSEEKLHDMEIVHQTTEHIRLLMAYRDDPVATVDIRGSQRLLRWMVLLKRRRKTLTCRMKNAEILNNFEKGFSAHLSGVLFQDN